MAFKIVGYRQMLQIIIMFMIVQFFGLLLTVLSLSGATYQQIYTNGAFSNTINVLFYGAYIIIISALIILFFKYFNGKIVFRIFEAVIIFFASFVVFSIIFGLFSFSNILVTSYLNVGIIASIFFALLLVYLKNRWQRLRNTTAIIASVGVGVILGLSFNFFDAMLFMCIIAVYDFIAVFITKHMISLANIVQDNNLAFMVGVNEVAGMPEHKISKEQAFELKSAYSKTKSPAIKRLISDKMVPVSANVALGTGDLSIPLMVAVSAAYASSVIANFILSFFVIFGGIFGLILTMFILRKYKRALPAIPPLLFGILIFVGLYYLTIHL
jgi:presenilin-like A22 family membrane protease